MSRRVVISMVVLAGVLANLPCQGAEFIEGLTVMPTGWMKFPGDIEMGVDHYSSQWVPTRQVLDAVVLKRDIAEVTEKQWSIKGTFAGFDFVQTLFTLSPTATRYHAEVSHSAGIPTNQLAFTVNLPVKRFQGQVIRWGEKKITLPLQYTDMTIFGDQHSNTLAISTDIGELSFRNVQSISVLDLRKFGDIHQNYQVRFLFSSDSGKIQKSSIDFEMSLKTYQTEPIGIAGQANMAFADENAADSKGGWTDQGPNNDLRMLPLGKKRFGGVLFDILDPAANKGKSCLVFSGPQRSGFLTTVVIPVADKTFNSLYFLHALAWTPETFASVGNILVDYADGSRQTSEVLFDRDLSNWWNALPTKNGDVVWSASNNSAYVGLFLTRFSVQPKPIRRLTLTTTQKAVWMIAAISGGEAVPRNFIPNPIYTVAGDAWKPYLYDLTVIPNSIMDFSFLNHKPAGKFGHVMVRDGHFAFSDVPEKNARFVGGNLCFSASFQDKTSSERMADHMARMGYNAVRLHHLDSTLANYSDSGVTLNPTELDKLDYLIYCCKERGIYTTIDLYTDRIISDGIIPEVKGQVHQDFKALVPILDSAMKNWKAYTKNLLTHVNPYTKLSWKDDPALFAICINNEDNLSYWWDQWPNVKELYLRGFEVWLKTHPVSGEKSRDIRFNEFLTELQLNSYKQCHDFIRSLGCKTLLTDVNFQDNVLTRVVRPNLDYVDNHNYRSVAGPIHRYGNVPCKNDQDNDITTRCCLVRTMFNSRAFGKPFMVTEFNQGFPNQYRGQSGLTMGAYAALQDWDGLFRFAYSHTAVNTRQPYSAAWMELWRDPLNLLSERLMVLLFLRGDVRPAVHAVPILADPEEYLTSSFDPKREDAYQSLGLFHRIGQCDNKKALPKSSIKNIPYRHYTAAMVDSLINQTQKESGVCRSDTGEIALYPAKGQMTVVTEKTEAFAVLPKAFLAGKIVSVENAGGFAIIAVSAMDTKPLGDSRKILVLHLTDITNSATKYFDSTRTIIEEWGTLPHLVRSDTATVKLNLDKNRKLRAWAITMSGERKNEIPVRLIDGAFEFTVNTNQPTGGCMTYEITVE
jgi:hypothetical protein